MTTETETYQFGMHQNLLYDVILKQAGTLQKAILEGVMNAIDAGATACHVEMDVDRFSVADNGHGFRTKDEIKEVFRVFGLPHQEGDATYGRFRMGRGQLFAFGVNTWRTRTFEMDVDIKGRGDKFELHEGLEDYPGTRVDVELYETIIPSDLERMKAELRNFVAWSQIPVYLNGEQISKTPSEAKWQFEDEHAYYNLSSTRSQLAVYNLGVLVNSLWAGRFGMGGTVVSKKQLDVNFARNDVQSTCSVFKAITAHIRNEAGQGIEKKARLTDSEREMLVRDFLAGALDPDKSLKLRVLTDGSGRSWALSKLEQIPAKYGNRLIVAEHGDQMLETAQRRGIAFTIDDATLERFGAIDGQGFKDRVRQCIAKIADSDNRSMGAYRLRLISEILEKVNVSEKSNISDLISPDHIALEEKELTAEQKILRRTIDSGLRTLIAILNRSSYTDDKFTYRRLHLGKSDTALAWTDGVDNIWLEVNHARLLRRGYSGAYQIAQVLLHEMIHDAPDTKTHQHDHGFYQSYHDLSHLPEDALGEATKRMLQMFLTNLRQHGKKVTKKLLEADDMDAQIEAYRRKFEDHPED